MQCIRNAVVVTSLPLDPCLHQDQDDDNPFQFSSMLHLAHSITCITREVK